MSLYNKLTSTQLKDLTSADVMKLGQLSFVDMSSIAQLNQLKNIQEHQNNLVSPGSQVFADSLKMSAQTVNETTASWKPSTVYSSEPYADTYLIQVLAISVMTTGGDTGTISIGLTDGSNIMVVQKATSVTAAGPLSFEPNSPLYINESNYLTINNAAGVDASVVVYCAIVSRGGAQ